MLVLTLAVAIYIVMGKWPLQGSVMGNEQKLLEVAKLFLKLGIIGFGGPAVHIAMMEEEVVRKKGWMTHAHFLDLVGATNLIPGPNSTEMTMHCGREQAGWKGLVVAGCCFILPAVIITGFFAWAYQQYGHLPQVERFVYGIKPAIISVIVAAMVPLAKKALQSLFHWIIGILALIAVVLGLNEVLVFFGAGLIGMLLFWARRENKFHGIGFLPLLQVAGANIGEHPMKLFWIFLKVGSVLYGSGYVLFAFLDAELVNNGLLTKQQLVDAVAVGQFTPGPVFSAATFIGWQVGGWVGALAATIGIFLPSFLFVALLNPIIPALRRSSIMSAFLDTVNVVAVAVILAVAMEMSVLVLTDWKSIMIALVSFAVNIFLKKVNTAFIVFGGAVLGYLLSFL